MDGLNRYKKGIGERIKLLRGGRSQSAFAAELKISLPSLQRYEYGDRLPQGSVLDRIASAGGRSVDWILTGQEAGADRVAEDGPRYSLRVDPILQQFRDLFEFMSEEERKKVLEYAEFISKRKKEDVK